MRQKPATVLEPEIINPALEERRHLKAAKLKSLEAELRARQADLDRLERRQGDPDARLGARGAVRGALADVIRAREAVIEAELIEIRVLVGWLKDSRRA